MADTINSPNMMLPVPVVSTCPGPDWANNINACLGIVDQHNHSAGSGVPVSQDGIGLTPSATTFDSLNFNTSNAYAVRSVRFTNQSGALSLGTDIGCIYESGGEFWYNDSSGNQVQITSGGVVNATSSGISSGTATASFVASVLVVNRASATPANIQCASILLGNNIASSNYLTLQPPNAMASSYALTMPSIPASQSFVTVDTAGSIAAYAATAGGITGSNIAAATIAAANIVNATLTGTQVSNNINLPGKKVQENSLNVVVSNTNAATNSLAIIRGKVNQNGTIASGEGFTITHTASSGVYAVTFSTAFLDVPSVSGMAAAGAAPNVINWASASLLSTGVSFNIYASTSGALNDSAFTFTAIGQRA